MSVCVAGEIDAVIQREVARLAGLHQFHVLVQSKDPDVVRCALFAISVSACHGTTQSDTWSAYAMV